MPTIRIAINLVYIYYRKMFVKGDLLAVGLLLTGFAVSLVAIYRHYADFYQVLFLFFDGNFFPSFITERLFFVKNVLLFEKNTYFGVYCREFTYIVAFFA